MLRVSTVAIVQLWAVALARRPAPLADLLTVDPLERVLEAVHLLSVTRPFSGVAGRQTRVALWNSRPSSPDFMPAEHPTFIQWCTKIGK